MLTSSALNRGDSVSPSAAEFEGSQLEVASSRDHLARGVSMGGCGSCQDGKESRPFGVRGRFIKGAEANV